MHGTYQAFQPTLTKPGLERFGLTLQYIAPSKALSHAVHSYLQISADRATPYPVIPDGTQAVFISPEGAQLSGAQSRICEVPILQPGSYFGIRFHPGSLRLFFDLDLSDITDQFIHSRDLSSRSFACLHEQVYRFSSFRQRAQACERWLLAQLGSRSVGQFDHALSLIYGALGDIRIAQLSANVGWSSRHLNRMFRLHTGLDAKSFSQTIRLQHACRRLYVTPTEALNIALETGFSDQSHMIKEFRQRLLSSPSSFYSRFMSDSYNP